MPSSTHPLLQPLGQPMIRDNVGLPTMSHSAFSRDIILPPISTIKSTAPNLPSSLPPFPPSFIRYPSNLNPTCSPLPAASDRNLYHGPTIAPAVSYRPADKAGGSCYKATPSNLPSSLPSFPPTIGYPSNLPPDPASIPLPVTSDCDLHHSPTIASAVGHKPANKAGGSRHRVTSSNSKALGKRKVIDVSDMDSVDSGDESEVAKAKGCHGGRRAGAGNYRDDDIDELLRLVEEELPIGGNGWKRIFVRYEQWATCKGRPVRDAKALESKFKGLAKMKKPTGNGKRPVHVTHAKTIDGKINEKLSLCHIDDPDADASDASNREPPSRIDKVYTAVACNGRGDVPEPHRTRAHQTSELIGKIATALDPETQRARDEERATRSLQQTHFLSLTNQLRDAQQLNRSLQTEMDQLRDRLYKVERIHDCLDMELNLERRMAGTAMLAASRQPRTRKHHSDLERVRGKVRSTIHYPEGGSHTTWVTDGSSASNFDENKENKFPVFPSYLEQPPSEEVSTNAIDHSASSSMYNSSVRPQISWEI